MMIPPSSIICKSNGISTFCREKDEGRKHRFDDMVSGIVPQKRRQLRLNSVPDDLASLAAAVAEDAANSP